MADEITDMVAGRRRPRILVVVWGAATAILLVPFFVAVGLAAYEREAWRRDPDNAALVETCGRCHNAESVHEYAKSPRSWRETIDRMLHKDPHAQPVPREKRDAILALLVRRRSADGDLLFRVRCHRCHTNAVVDDYVGLAWPAFEAMIRRHVRENGTAINGWEGEAVLDELRSRFADADGPSPEARVQLLYENRCGVCHTVSFRYKEIFREPKGRTEWTDIVERMRRKAPDLIVEDEVPPLVDHSMALQETGGIVPPQADRERARRKATTHQPMPTTNTTGG